MKDVVCVNLIRYTAKRRRVGIVAFEWKEPIMQEMGLDGSDICHGAAVAPALSCCVFYVFCVLHRNIAASKLGGDSDKDLDVRVG